DDSLLAAIVAEETRERQAELRADRLRRAHYQRASVCINCDVSRDCAETGGDGGEGVDDDDGDGGGNGVGDDGDGDDEGDGDDGNDGDADNGDADGGYDGDADDDSGGHFAYNSSQEIPLTPVVTVLAGNQPASVVPTLVLPVSMSSASDFHLQGQSMPVLPISVLPMLEESASDASMEEVSEEELVATNRGWKLQVSIEKQKKIEKCTQKKKREKRKKRKEETSGSGNVKKK
ncbi:hypothetical protein NQ317_013971, partial [Molorchus minor]